MDYETTTSFTANNRVIIVPSSASYGDVKLKLGGVMSIKLTEKKLDDILSRVYDILPLSEDDYLIFKDKLLKDKTIVFKRCNHIVECEVRHFSQSINTKPILVLNMDLTLIRKVEVFYENFNRLRSTEVFVQQMNLYNSL